MNTMLVTNHQNALHIETRIPGQRVTVLRYGNANEPLTSYLPIKILPLNESGVGEYDTSANISIPEVATHIWASSFCATEHFASAPISAKQLVFDEKIQLAFYVISDIHTISKGGKQLKFQAETYKHIANKDTAFVLVAGDIANGVQAEEYSICSRQIATHLANIPVLTIFGNHDFHSNHAQDAPDHKSRLDFQNWINERNQSCGVSINRFDEYNYSTCINGINIVALQGHDYKNKVYSVGDDILPWLNDSLSAYSGKMQIVFSHYPIAENDGRIYLREHTKLRRILEQYDNIYYFAGHTHDSLDSDVPSIIQRGTATYVNTASVGNTEPCPRDVRELKPLRDKKQYPSLEDYFCRRSMGIRVDVYNSSVLIRGVDFTQNKFVPRCIKRITRCRVSEP